MRSFQAGHYGTKARSMVDGQSHHSFSNNSNRYFGNATLTSNLINTRPGKKQLKSYINSLTKELLINFRLKLFFYFRIETIKTIPNSSFGQDFSSRIFCQPRTPSLIQKTKTEIPKQNVGIESAQTRESIQSSRVDPNVQQLR